MNYQDELPLVRLKNQLGTRQNQMRLVRVFITHLFDKFFKEH